MAPDNKDRHQNGRLLSDDPDDLNGDAPVTELGAMLEGDDEEFEDADERQTQCGVGDCRPSWAQPCATIQCFTLTLSLWSLFGSVNFSYYSSVITQIEREFGLPSSFTGFIKNVDNIGYLCTVLIFAHFCRNANKPRLFASVTVLSSIAIFLFAVPHFVYGMGDRSLGDTATLSNGTWFNTSAKKEAQVEYCDGITEGATELRCGGSAIQSTLNTGAIALFVVSELLQGVAQSPKFALSLTYMDDNARDDSPKYFSFMFAMRSISPVLGFVLGAWTTTLYVNLTDPGFGSKDPRWIGAWWLGFVICAAGNLIWALPMLLFPPVLRTKHNTVVNTKKSESIAKKAKDLPRALARLISNKLYVVVTVGLAFEVYMMGFFTFLPKYFEQYFGATASTASLITGTIGAVAMGLGPLIGGRIVTCWGKLTPTLSMKFICATTLSSVIGFIIMLFMSCPDTAWAGGVNTKNPDLRLECNGNCSCDSMSFIPICGDGISYYSPCHAGCTGKDLLNGTEVFTDCSCIPGGLATVGACPKTCNTLIPFAAVLFITNLIAAIDKIPTMTLFMRCVDYRDKALSVAVVSAFLQIIVFPAPMLFGYVLDSACLVLRGACAASSGRRGGACALYDTDTVRYRVFGLCIGLKACALLIYIGAYFISKRPEYSDYEKTEGRPAEEENGVIGRRKDRQANKRLSQISVDVVDQAMTSI